MSKKTISITFISFIAILSYTLASANDNCVRVSFRRIDPTAGWYMTYSISDNKSCDGNVKNRTWKSGSASKEYKVAVGATIKVGYIFYGKKGSISETITDSDVKNGYIVASCNGRIVKKPTCSIS